MCEHLGSFGRSLNDNKPFVSVDSKPVALLVGYLVELVSKNLQGIV